MSAVNVNALYPIFTDIDGQPLEDGYVWIGVSGLEPQANPQAAYWDAALTQVVTQPARTRGGYALNGTAIGRLFTAAPYSIKVQNKRTSTIATDLSASSGTGVGSISFGSTGLTPATPTDGDVVVAGTLAVANGGTGVTTATGTGSVVRATSPALVTPALGAATATTLVASTNAGAVPASTLTGGTTVVSVHGTDAGATRQMIAGYGGGAALDFRRSNGTAVSPTALALNNVIGQMNASGYGASAFSTSPRAQFIMYAAEAWTNSAQGTFMSFTITPAGGTSTTEVGRVETNGRLEFGNAVNLNGPALSTTAPADLYIRSGNTYVDNTTAASGTVAHGAVSSFGAKGIASANATVTYTNASTIFVHGAPGAGANVTITNPWTVYLAVGKSYLGDNVDGNPANVDSVGFRGVPVNSQSAAYQLVAADAGKSIVHPITDNNARTFTIPANGTVPFPIGTTITFINLINTVTIAITTDTMYLAGAGTTGSRTLAAYGMATAVKVGATSWIISGSNLS